MALAKETRAPVPQEGPCPTCNQPVRWIKDERNVPVACQLDTTAVLCPDGILTHGYEPHQGYCKGDSNGGHEPHG